jgi:hypothetical protein
MRGVGPRRRPTPVYLEVGAWRSQSSASAWRFSSLSAARWAAGALPAPPDGAPVPVVPGGPGTRLRLQLAAAVHEGDRGRALELAQVAQIPVAELHQMEVARRLARLPLLLRLLAEAVRRLAASQGSVVLS